MIYYGDVELWERKDFYSQYKFSVDIEKYKKIFKRAVQIFRKGFTIPVPKGDNLSHNTKICVRLFNDFPELYLNFEKKVRNGGHEVTIN